MLQQRFKMLNQATNYTDLERSFVWQLPEKYNIGVDVCDKWAEQDPGWGVIFDDLKESALV